MISKKLADEIVIGLNIAYECNLPKGAVDTILLICSEYEAAQQAGAVDGALLCDCGEPFPKSGRCKFCGATAYPPRH